MNRDTDSLLSRSLRRNLIAGVATVVLLFAGAGGWAATTELSGAVIATGILVVDGNAKKVQHPTGGIVAELRVKEGQLVRAGDIVARLDATVTSATLDAAAQNLDQLYARQVRLEAERDGFAIVQTAHLLSERLSHPEAEAAMATERRLFDDRRAAREGKKARLREQIAQLHEQITGLDVQQEAKAQEIALIDKELEGTRKLFEMGIIPLNRVNNLDRNVARLDGERGQLLASIASAKGRIAETEIQLEQVDQDMRAEVAGELRDVRNKQTELVGQEIKARDELKHVDIKAPISGAIHRLSIHTQGGVITSAETLMEIVPQGSELTVDARIAPQDIDQISIGLPATLRLSAFNRNTTPELTGSVVRVSADLETDEKTGQSFYRAGITIPKGELGRLPGLAIIPGMPVEAFIATGERTVASYFLKPIRDHAQRALRQE